MTSPLSKEQERLRGQDVRTMSDQQLEIWIDACEKMQASVPHKNGRKGWGESKKLAIALLEKRKKKKEPIQPPETTRGK